MKKKTNYGRIKKALCGTQQQITTVMQKKPLKYAVTECINVLRNMWAEPEYTHLWITPKAWYKLVAFINLVGDYEISGFGRIEKRTCPDNNTLEYAVTDFDIIRQEVKAAYVESDEDAVLEFIMKLPADQRNQWTLDWHSHVNMGTSPSGTDWNNYSDMLKARMGKQFPSMVVNKRGEITAQQIMSESRHPEIRMFVMQQALSESDIQAVYDECKAKVESLCTKAVVYQTAKKSDEPKVSNFNYRNNTGAGYGYTNESRWWEEDEWQDDLVSDNKEIETSYEMDDCQYCGAPASKWHTEQIGVGICKECFDDLTH